MFRKPLLFSAFALFALALSGAAQSDSPAPAAQPSLGDLARQLRNQKAATTQPAKVITNDNLTPGGDIFSLQPAAISSSSRSTPSAATAPNFQGLDQVHAALDRLDAVLGQVEALDPATLERNALGGTDVNFPGRGAWEQRLLAARAAYVSEGRSLVRNARTLMQSAQDLDSAHAQAGDPRVQDLDVKLQQFVQECVRTGTAFQAVMLEGRDLAHQAAASSSTPNAH